MLTDHGDGTRPPDPPSYRHGVLVIDAVELNTSAGHVVALGLTRRRRRIPWPATPRDVIDDIRRLGGAAVIAHPDSPNPALRWRGQNVAADGIEWLNVDSEWRDDPPTRLVATALRSLIRGPEVNRLAVLAARRQASAGSMPRRDNGQHSRWQRSTRTPTSGGATREEPRQRSVIARPTYEAMFRTVAQAVVLDAPLSQTGTRRRGSRSSTR